MLEVQDARIRELERMLEQVLGTSQAAAAIPPLPPPGERATPASAQAGAPATGAAAAPTAGAASTRPTSPGRA